MSQKITVPAMGQVGTAAVSGDADADLYELSGRKSRFSTAKGGQIGEVGLGGVDEQVNQI